jgi:hypothetical protein
MADVGSRDQKIRMRVIEYCADVEGQDVPEMFCLLTDLDDWRANPVAVLAAAYKWRWDGSETALRGAKSAIRGAGPSTGPIFRSRTPDMIRHDHAAWITATELVRDQSRNRTSTWHCSMQPSAPETPSPPFSTATLTQTASYALPAGDSPFNVAVQSGKIWVSYDTGTPFAAAVGYFDPSASSPALQTPAVWC